MKLWDRLFNKVKQKTVAFFSSTIGGGFEDWFDALNLNAYKDSLYLNIGVSMIRETVSGIPLEMHRIKNKEGDTEEVIDDPFLEVLGRPNYLQTQKEFWKLSVAYYLLCGEAFWYLEREGEKSVPTAMVNMRPDHVEILFSTDRKNIVGYEFRQGNGEILKIRPEDVLHIKNIDPTNPARGLGVLRPAAVRILTEKEAAQYQAQTFKSQGRPDIAVFTNEDSLTDEQGEEAREKWDKIYGNKNKRNAGFFGGNIKDIKLLNVSPKEMDGIESMKFLREDILSALRIPKQMIDTDVNYANSRVAYATFLSQACEPVLDAFLDVVNNKYLTDQDEDKFLWYETEVGEDRELILKEAVESKKAAIITQNEARELLGWPSVEGGDVFSEQTSPFTLSLKRKALKKKAKALLRKRPVLVKKFAAIEAIQRMNAAEAHLKGVKRQQNPLFHTKEMKEAYIRAYNDNIDRRSRIFLDHVNVYNEALAKRIIKQMEEFGINPDRVFDAVVELPEAKRVFEPLMEALYTKAGQDTMDQIANGFTGKASEHFVTIDEVLKALRLRAEFFITSMLNTDFKELKKVLANGLAEGKGVDEIGRDIRQYFDDMSVARAKTIARTETGRIVSQATDEAYRQSAVVTGKEWLTAGDDKVRDNAGTVDDHVVNAGVIVAPGGVFPNGERFPGELTINCRCALAPAV